METFKNGSNIFGILSEAISESIVVVNKSQLIVATNRAANIVFGYNEEELIGKHLDGKIFPVNFKLNGMIPVEARNKEQKFALNVLTDDSEKIS